MSNETAQVFAYNPVDSRDPPAIGWRIPFNADVDKTAKFTTLDAPVPALVGRFDIEAYSDFSAK